MLDYFYDIFLGKLELPNPSTKFHMKLFTNFVKLFALGDTC